MYKYTHYYYLTNVLSLLQPVQKTFNSNLINLTINFLNKIYKVQLSSKKRCVLYCNVIIKSL